MAAAKQGRVLVVDDDPDIRELLKNALDEHGYGIDAAADAAEARRRLTREEYDLVVTDLLLGAEGDGLFVARYARGRRCRVLLVTGDHARAELLDASGFPYLLKPFRVGTLLAAIDTIVSER
jgi:two-component system phosphate regulon response regulator OmpR